MNGVEIRVYNLVEERYPIKKSFIGNIIFDFFFLL